MVPTTNLTSTASSSCVDNKGEEHGPFKGRSNRGLNQTLLTNPHDALGPAESLQSPPPPVDLTHHQVVIS